MVIGVHPSLHALYELEIVVSRWAEDCRFAHSERLRRDVMGSSIFVCYLSLTPDLHAMLSAVTKTVLDRMDVFRALIGCQIALIASGVALSRASELQYAGR
jgi:hypothetical protein